MVKTSKLNGSRELPPDTAKRMRGGQIYVLQSTTSETFKLHDNSRQALNSLGHNR
jgi:hypothetical protein